MWGGANLPTTGTVACCGLPLQHFLRLWEPLGPGAATAKTFHPSQMPKAKAKEEKVSTSGLCFAQHVYSQMVVVEERGWCYEPAALEGGCQPP